VTVINTPSFDTIDRVTTRVRRPVPDNERATLAAAVGGDEAAFRDLVEPYRAGLHAHCYQMLASIEDAEDALQDALLKAWTRLAQFEGRSSLRTWLYTIATRSALDLTARRPMRMLPFDGELDARSVESGAPLSETVWIEPYPADQIGLASGFASPEARVELRESVELAFVAAVQHLAPRQRATLLLREVLGFSAHETAEMLGTTVAGVNSALERARSAVALRCPDPSQQLTLRSLGDARIQDLVTRYMDTLERADLQGLLGLLVEDASWAMPPETEYFRGYAAITGFLEDTPFVLRWRHLPASASGQIAVGCYLWDEASGRYAAHVIDVLTLRGERVSAVTAFGPGDIFPRFGLPLELPADTEGAGVGGAQPSA
jgi:RNA polymerase sigma-70 factor, ECF subfamily